MICHSLDIQMLKGDGMVVVIGLQIITTTLGTNKKFKVLRWYSVHSNNYIESRPLLIQSVAQPKNNVCCCC